MARFEDWPERLAAFFVARSHAGFVWGKTDCLMTVCDAIEAITGIDPGAEYRGRYSDEASMRALVLRSGFGTLEELVAAEAARHEFPEIPPKLAGRGDLVLLDAPEGPAWGLVYLNGRDALFSSERGLGFRPVSEIRRAWRVG